MATHYKSKRIIVCCDGTWVDALGSGDNEPQSNVTRISRVLKRVCSDNTSQVIMYDPGVGTGYATIEQLTGGAFGMGLGQNIREAYNFICGNYVDGDEIILIGFSRGAFTARSVGDMIASIGLLTPAGLDHFYSIFQDYENMGDEKRTMDKFLCSDLAPYQSDLTPYHGEKGKEKIRWEKNRKDEYREWLKRKDLTRDTHKDGLTEIKIKCIAVWDTVGALGIPPVPIIGIQGSARQWKFTNTQISEKVEHAFQALALDEPRAAFSPALWERIDGCKTDLKQVWFPGNHGNIGGGWYDQQIANISLAWMCDQLSTVGVEFNKQRMTRTFMDGLRYSAEHTYPYVPLSFWKKLLGQSTPKPWASKDLTSGPKTGQKIDDADCTGKDHHPNGNLEDLWPTARSWALGQIRYPDSWIQVAAGTIVRHPGMFMRVNPETNAASDEPLLNTNERIHSCVRVRLACQGLGLDDKKVWDCPSLKRDEKTGRPLWRLEKKSGSIAGADQVGPKGQFRPRELDLNDEEYSEDNLYQIDSDDGQWQWQWVFDHNADGSTKRPPVMVIPEEPMVGYWERHLLSLTKGETDVWRWAQNNSLTAMEGFN